MSQYPGPPGAYLPPGAPNQPPRRGWPWWAWLLGGCAGCSLLAIAAIAVMVFMGVKAVSSVGPITPATLQQQMGSDVPLYPGSNIETSVTRLMRGFMPKQIFRGLAILITSDPSEKVHSFYAKRLAAGGWKKLKEEDTGLHHQTEYQKGREMLVVQTQPQGGGTMILLMRGGPELANQKTDIPGSP